MDIENIYYMAILYFILISVGSHKFCLPEYFVLSAKTARQNDYGKLSENRQRKEMAVMEQYENKMLQSKLPQSKTGL